MLPDFAVNSVIKIAHNEGFTDFKITTKSGSNQGDNFQSVMYAINLYGTRRINGKMQLDELDLLCKATPGNDTRRKNFSSSVVFDREIYIYSKVLPAFTKFQKDKGLSDEDSYKSYPVVYACEEDEETGLTMLMMEDLRPKNYKMWPKEKTMRLDHELMILRELGKCHGVAMAMKDQRPSVFQEFKKLPDVYIRVLANGALKSFIKSVLKQAVGVLENPKHKRMMENFVNTYLDRVNKLKSDQNCDEFGVIVHGDCWNNNFLFQYDANKPNEMKLTNFCLVDWQYTHYSPPVIDVLYNIFSSTDKPYRDLNYEKLLQTYYSSLSETIRKLGSDPNKLYTYENFRMQMRKYSEYALLLAPMIYTLRLAQAEDAVNLDDFANSLDRGEEASIVKPFHGQTRVEFSRLINGLVTDFVEFGYVKCD